MTNPLFQPFNLTDLLAAKASGNSYTFTFETNELDDLGMSESAHSFVLVGFSYDLVTLKTQVPRPPSTTRQVSMLYDASRHVDHLLIAYDQGTQEITGTWPGV
jgi:hypothetical protein